MDLAAFKGLNRIVSLFHRPATTRAALTNALLFVIWEAIVIGLELLVNHHVWIIGQVMLIPMGMYAVAMGVEAERKIDPIQHLVAEENGPNAPFMFSRGFKLYHEREFRGLTEEDRDNALSALADALNNPMSQTDYVPAILKDIRTKAVWAVCGRKDQATADSLYGACVESFTKRGNHVERIFFPPLTAEDAKVLRSAITKHLSAGMNPRSDGGMTVRVFRSWQVADAVLHNDHLPRGFGMTLMGQCPRVPATASIEPVENSIDCVLIHWGGLGTGDGDHKGIVLRGRVWGEFFRDLFVKVSKNTFVANSNDPHGATPTCPMEWETFVDKNHFPHYGVPRR